MKNSSKPSAKPFLKWAGGKTQLLEELAKRIPDDIKDIKTINSYIEPFVGSGAFFFYLKNRYKIKHSYLLDNNKDLIITYQVIQKDPTALIKKLKGIEYRYLRKESADREAYYYRIRKRYNNHRKRFTFNRYSHTWVQRAAYLVFLNRTCFNGLFRLNRAGEFNVPYGRYKNPTIIDKTNILQVNRALQNTVIECADFTRARQYVKGKTLIYCDPPYRPLNITSNFTGFTENGFSDEDQKRLANFYRQLSDKKDLYLMLSNSDPKNVNPADTFFDSLYKGFTIDRVDAKRMINCDAKKRGQIKELLIANY